MTRRAALFVLAFALSPILQAAVVQDLTGKWDGTFIATVNGQQEDDVVFMTLTQKGAVLTGTVGPSLDRQWAIIGGKVEGTKVTFDTQSDGPFVKFTLTLVDGRLKGDAVAEMDGQKMTAKVDVGRSK
ncbi:MAG TPA: hypothetical protein PKW63_07140 [Vicinamibacterales bacterium]|nr:hypothetical protein [Vicinamibacterales bacterium]